MSTTHHKKLHASNKTKQTSNTTKEQIVFVGQDKQLYDQVVAPSKEIDAIASSLIIRDTEYIVEYLRQRINLEQKYLNDLSNITRNIQKCCIPSDNNLIQKSFMDYVGLSDQHKPFREEYIQQLKQQCDSLTQFRNEQQRLYDKNKSWMNQVNGDYLVTRLKKLPSVHEIYVQKWDEMERSTGGAAVASPMLTTPMTPIFSSMRPSTDEDFDARTTMSMDDDRSVRKFADLVNTSQSSRIERFMKRHLNKPEDATSKNIKLAKLKVEVSEADVNYRNVVRELNTMTIKTEATNLHILNNVQAALKEKSDKVQAMLQATLKADLHQMEQRQTPIHSLLSTVDSINNSTEAKKFNTSSTRIVKSYRKPEPVYYQNYHVGVCKDLIFGTSLTEYAQQKHRSPPLLITKCIDAIERLGGLEKEGIYRVSGKQSNMEKIKHAFELDEEAAVIGQNDIPEDVFSIASVIKIFLRELKTPLFPFKLTDRLVYSQIPDQELRLMNLLTRLLKLPPANYDTLKALIHHLSKLHAHVEKNKMTTSNLTLIFTPAIFQDLNHAQNSPGEWHKDCVLEDLIMNNHDIFANKDLHNNSAITGDIEYGFHQDEQDQPNRYAMTIQSPDSPTGTSHEVEKKEYSFVTEEEEAEEEVEEEKDEEGQFIEPSVVRVDSLQQQQQPNTLTQQETPSRSSSVEGKRYQAHFQGKGLKVDTSAIATHGNSLPGNKDHHIPIVKSATVPSYDWLKMDPESSNHPMAAVPKLRRSATTGKKVLSRRKLSSSNLRGDAANDKNGSIPSVPILSHRVKNGVVLTSSTTTIP